MGGLVVHFQWPFFIPFILPLTLAASDILVDGKYMAEKRDIGLAFRGSANQRLIDVPRSLLAGQAVLWEELDTGDKLFA